MNWIKALISILWVLPLGAWGEVVISPDPRPPGFCMQNFNAYGPIYASKVTERTGRMNMELQGIPKCHVVHLQEVWNSSQIRQIEQDLQRQYSISSPNKDNRIGLMSLSMGDILSTETHYFKVNSDGGILDKARSVVDVRKAFHVMRSNLYGIDEDFLFVNFHLHPMSTAVRLAQLLDVLQWRLENTDLKIVMTGDLNADPGSLEHRTVKTVLGMYDSLEEHIGAYVPGVCTYCFGNPHGWKLSSHVFDYVFYSNVSAAPTELKVVNSFINMRGTPTRPMSDHFGVRTNFSVEPLSGNLFTNADKEVFFKVLDEIEKVFATQKDPAFREYRERIEVLRRQVESQYGEYWQYLLHSPVHH